MAPRGIDGARAGLGRRLPPVSSEVAGRPYAVQITSLVSRALDKSDQKLLRLMTKRVGVALRTQRENGTITRDEGLGQFVLWRVAQ